MAPLSDEFKAKVKNAWGLCEKIDKAREEEVENAVLSANATIKDLEKINATIANFVYRYRVASQTKPNEIPVMTFTMRGISCELYIDLTGVFMIREIANKNVHALSNFVFAELPSEAAYDSETGRESWGGEPSSFDPCMCLAVDYAMRPIFSKLDDIASKYGIDASASLWEKPSGKKGKGVDSQH